MAPIYSPVTATTLPPILDAETGAVVMTNRIKDAATLASTYQSLFIADFPSSQARALVQAEVDGNPPFSEAADRARGVAGRTNINFGFNTQSQMDVEKPFNAVFDSIDVFGSTPTTFGEDTERERWSQIIAEEATRMVRNWENFPQRTQMCVHLFTMFGVAFTYREDELDWRWQVDGLDALKLPRRTRAEIGAVDFVTCKRSMLPSKLHEKIENSMAAQKSGWNVEAVKAAIVTATQHSPDGSNPEEMERTIKDQDYFSGVSATTVDVVHGWVAEVDGSVTHIISRYDGVGEFLYKQNKMYGCLSQFITAYTYGVGSNGDFYSLRGNAWRGHNMSVALNLLTGKFFDQAIWASTPLIECESEDAVIDQAIQPAGPYNKITTSQAKFVEVPHADFQTSLIPAIQKAQDIFSMRTRAPGSNLKYQGATPKTAEEVKAQQALDGSLTTEMMDLFFTSWKNDFKEVVRRIINKDLTASHPGGAEAFEFRKRCMARGVPIDAIYAVDVAAIEINRGVGKGSVQERRTAFSALMPEIGRFDQKGQQILLWNLVAAYTDVSFANRLVPDVPGERPPMDLQIANLENASLSLGQPAIIVPNQNHVIHVGAHLEKLRELEGLLGNLQLTIEQAIPQMQPVWIHALEHLEYIAPNDTLYPVYKEALEQLGEAITNGQKHLDAEARKAEEEGMGEQIQPTDASREAIEQETRLKVMEKGQDLAFKQEAHTQRLTIEQQKAAQDLKIKAVKTAAEVQARANKPKPAPAKKSA